MMLKSNIIAYTDDVVLLSPSLTGLQNLINAFDNNINITICCDILYHYMMLMILLYDYNDIVWVSLNIYFIKTTAVVYTLRVNTFSMGLFNLNFE